MERGQLSGSQPGVEMRKALLRSVKWYKNETSLAFNYQIDTV